MKKEGIVREFGMDMYTLLNFKWITNKDLLYQQLESGDLALHLGSVSKAKKMSSPISESPVFVCVYACLFFVHS